MIYLNNKSLIKVSLVLISFFILNSHITQSYAYDEDTRYYDVEIIVFENTRPKYRQSE